jgi:hypothetical protein
VLTVALRTISSRSTCVAPVLIGTAEAEPESTILAGASDDSPFRLRLARGLSSGPDRRVRAPLLRRSGFPANSGCSSCRVLTWASRIGSEEAVSRGPAEALRWTLILVAGW